MRANEPTYWFKFQNAFIAASRLRAICAPLVCGLNPQTSRYNYGEAVA
jgi:hypothetical protein